MGIIRFKYFISFLYIINELVPTGSPNFGRVAYGILWRTGNAVNNFCNDLLVIGFQFALCISHDIRLYRSITPYGQGVR